MIKKRINVNKAVKGNIKFSDKSHTVNGIISTIVGAISVAIMFTIITVSCMQRGEAGVYIGAIGLTGLIIAIVGLYLGIKSFGERECYYLFSKIGCILNTVMILIWVSFYVIGCWF